MAVQMTAAPQVAATEAQNRKGQYERLRRVAFAAACKCRKYGRFSDADVDDAVSRGVEAGLCEPSGIPERENKKACQRVRSHLRACKRAEERHRGLGQQMFEGDASPFGSKEKAPRGLLRPKPAVCRALAQDIETYERSLLHAIETGELVRASRLEQAALRERRLYLRGIRMVVQRAGVEVEPGKVIDELVSFRTRELNVQCPLCAPSSLWVICEHTKPVFKGGKLVSGIDLRGRGRRSRRWPLLMSFNGGPHVDRSNYLAEDAAARLSTELLRLCGVDPYVKHTLERLREKAKQRERASFIRDWHAGRVQSGERARAKARERDAEISPEQRELLTKIMAAVNREIDDLCLCDGPGKRFCTMRRGHAPNIHRLGAESWAIEGAFDREALCAILKDRKAWAFDALRLPDLEAAAADLDRRGYVLNGTWRDAQFGEKSAV
jgi:hypothetical protein